MTRSPFRTFGATLVLGAALVLATACSAPATPPSATTTSNAESPVATPKPTPSDTTTANPTCETILPATTVASFKTNNWSARQDPFRIGSLVLDGGLQCTWGNLEVASDHVQLFGWAPISSNDADAAINDLVSQGWVREESDAGTYVTENPANAVATDEDGYGWTYLFVNGAVTFADTKQSLILVEWPAR